MQRPWRTPSLESTRSNGCGGTARDMETEVSRVRHGVTAIIGSSSTTEVPRRQSSCPSDLNGRTQSTVPERHVGPRICGELRRRRNDRPRAHERRHRRAARDERHREGLTSRRRRSHCSSFVSMPSPQWLVQIDGLRPRARLRPAARRTRRTRRTPGRASGDGAFAPATSPPCWLRDERAARAAGCPPRSASRR